MCNHVQRDELDAFAMSAAVTDGNPSTGDLAAMAAIDIPHDMNSELHSHCMDLVCDRPKANRFPSIPRRRPVHWKARWRASSSWSARVVSIEQQRESAAKIFKEPSVQVPRVN